MSIRWCLVLVWFLTATALAEDSSDSIPDVGFDSDESSDDEHGLEHGESRNIRPRAYSGTFAPNNVPSGFRPSPELSQTYSTIETTVIPQRRPQQPLEQESYINLVPVRPQQAIYEQQSRPQQQQQQRLAHKKLQDLRGQQLKQQQQELEEELEEEKEEPDRLSLLLQQSKFDCVKRGTGYYADEELQCEVFHYCQDGVKHSWICPNGFTFHQVHLICMPPSGDNICQRSSKYHFVNDYLYRPINAEEVQRKPNVSLRYSDRYYPADIYHDDRFDEEEEDDEQLQDLRGQQLKQQQQELEEELEEEKEEPDRLSLLLQQSKFDCVKRGTGYYADEELQCEVFHYCQDGVKHSWICPNGFTFHQVHLICMPPSGDNICQRSSKYHFVNDYLYRPINAEEVQRKPNVSLRYSDRYYPADIYHDDRFDEEEEDDEQTVEQHRPRPAPPAPRPAPRPQSQAFRSAEEVNIPLQQRRPSTIQTPARPYIHLPTTPADFDYQ